MNSPTDLRKIDLLILINLVSFCVSTALMLFLLCQGRYIVKEISDIKMSRNDMVLNSNNIQEKKARGAEGVGSNNTGASISRVPVIYPQNINIALRPGEINSLESIHMTKYCAKGYYTLFMFSAEWCHPCKVMFYKRLPVLQKKFNNLNGVYADTSEFWDEGEKEKRIIKIIGSELKVNGTLPIGILLDENGGVVGKSAGEEAIVQMIETNLAK